MGSVTNYLFTFGKNPGQNEEKITEKLIHFCSDFSELVSVTVKDDFPLPEMDESVRRLCKGKSFIILNLR